MGLDKLCDFPGTLILELLSRTEDKRVKKSHSTALTVLCIRI